MSADEAAPDGCPECGCGSHWRVRGALCRDCGHAAHAGVPRRRRPRVKVEPDRQAAILLAVGGALLLFCAGGPEYRLPGGGPAQELARESTQALGGFTGLLAGLAAVLALREPNRVPPGLAAAGSLFTLLALGRDVHDYEQLATAEPTGFLVAVVAGALLTLVGGLRAALYAARHGG